MDLNSGLGIQPLWIPAASPADTDEEYGWTAARTLGNSQHPGIGHGPRWNQDEIPTGES